MFEGAEPDPQVVQFVQNNYLWVLEQADRLWTQDIYWMELKGILRQINGTVRGLEEGCPAQFGPNADPKSPLRKLSVLPLTLMKMLLMNANGDLFQIVHKFTAERYYHDHRQHPISSIRNETREWIEDALHDTLEDVGLFRGKGKKGKSSPIRKLASESLRKRRHENPAAEGLEGLTKEHRQELVATTNGDRGKKSPKKSQRHQSNRRQLRALGKFPGRPYGSTSGEDHCSALIKILPDGSDVVFGHDTWDDFQNAAPRIIKYYQQDSLLVADWPLPYVSAPDKENKAESRTGNRMSTYFSSSPGFLSSVDDFYLISDRHSTDKKLHEKDHFLSYSLAVMETSIDVYDDAILELVTEKSVLSWMRYLFRQYYLRALLTISVSCRARIANAQSKDGLSWSQTFSRYESGTYINQWMILDMLKFKPNSSSGVSSDTKVKSEAVEGAAVEASHSSSGVQEGFLYVLEEVPGYIHFADLSQVLIDKGYWASYNDPYFPDIRSLSGYQAKCDQVMLSS